MQKRWRVTEWWWSAQVDRAGNVWQRIGRRYLEPGVSTRRSGGEDDETSEAPPETEADHQRAEPTLLENQEEWVARVQSALAPTGEPAGSIRQALLQAYQGLSPALVQQVPPPPRLPPLPRAARPSFPAVPSSQPRRSAPAPAIRPRPWQLAGRQCRRGTCPCP